MDIFTDFERAVDACYIANTSAQGMHVLVAGPEDGQWTVMREYDAEAAGHEGTRYR
jgi:hypothetical protein